MMAAPRIVALLGAGLAAAGIVAVAHPVYERGEASAQPQLALAAAKGKLRISNSKDGQAILGTDDWVPGQRVKGKVAIANVGGVAARTRLAVGRIADVPGLAGGRLSRATRIKVARKRSVLGRFETVYSGTLAKLDGVAVGEWPAGGTRYFRLRATLSPPDGSDDRYQGATLELRFVWKAKPAQ